MLKQEPSIHAGGILLLTVLVVGCGGQEGPTRYELSGDVTFNGQPVPAGSVQFAPDTARGNSGPGTTATIIDGHYQTPSGKGTVGGPHKVTIYGYDGNAEAAEGSPFGTSIFPGYETEVDLPKEATTHNFDVPGTR